MSLPSRPLKFALPSWARRWVLAIAAVGLLVGADVASKTWAENHLRRAGARSVLGDWVMLRYQTNSGIAFGIFRAPIVHWKRRALIAYSSIVSVGLFTVLAWRLSDPSATRLSTTGVAALLAGSLGNLRDRITRGAVIDFIDLQPPGGVSWPAFNLADVYLAVGLGLCVTGLTLSHLRHRETPG